jgi:hypothetical protein
LRYRNITIPLECGQIQFALSFMNCVISRIAMSCECADRQTMMAASLPERMQFPDLRVPRLSVGHWLSEDDERFQLGIQELNLINEGGMEHLIPMLSHKFLECC